MSGRWTRRAQGGEGVFFSRPGSEIEDRRSDAYINMRDEMPSDAWVTYGIVYWPQPVKIIVYFIGLIWSFLAVGIIADVFMAAIEVITSAEKIVNTKNPDGSTSQVTVKIWNATVANLTLMALGSSAPEILLSVYEILLGNLVAGELGPSTIVGSAAFNLLVITAVCVRGIPNGETRMIADMGVFKITAFASVFAYVWLLIILLMPWSPEVVDVPEAFLTFIFFPVLVAAAYGADKNWFRDSKVSPAAHVIQIGGQHYRPGEAVELLKKIDTNGLSQEEQAQIVVQLAMQNKAKPSRAQLRMQAVRSMTGQKRVVPPKPKPIPIKYKTEGGAEEAKPRVFFGDASGAICTKYAVLESEPFVELTVLRDPSVGELKVKFATIEGTAKAGLDFEAQEGVLHFTDGEHYKNVSIKIFDDEEVEEDEKFEVKLYEVEGCPLDLEGSDKSMNALVTIIDDDEPGEVGFLEEHLQISVLESQGFVDVPVTRQNGSAGAIKIKYTTVDGSAIAGKDYTAMSDEIEFQRGQITKMLRIPITVDQRYELEETFKVNLEFVSGPPRATLCERHSSTITITSDEKTKELCDKVAALVNLNVDKYKVGGSNYAQQFKDALLVNGGDDDEDDGPPGTMAYVMHFLTLPWKLIYALVPPTDYLGGKLCFGIALAFIGVTTIFIADLASMFGCSLEMSPSMCAITFVALGTSLPDTFASQAAAIGDDTADAAVGNVTGSNSVNVFLGLGLPWLIAAVYWAIDGGGETEPNILWDSIYGCWDKDLSAWREGSSPRAELKDYAKDFSPDGRTFIVPSGALGVSVGIFSCCALTCLATLYYRRVTLGAELGGDQKKADMHAAFFIFLWMVYVGGSAVQEATAE